MKLRSTLGGLALLGGLLLAANLAFAESAAPATPAAGADVSAGDTAWPPAPSSSPTRPRRRPPWPGSP